MTRLPSTVPSRPTNLWPRSGFTVIEMLVVLALSSVLLVGLMSIVKLFGTYHQTITDEFPNDIWKIRLREQLRADVINSREYRINSGKLELIGYASKDFITGESQLMPSNIVYRTVNAGDEQTMLIRSETHYTPTGRVVWRSELMAMGFATIQFERTEDWTNIGFSRQSVSAAPKSDAYSRISDRMTLVFYANENTDQASAPQQRDWVIPIVLR